VDRADRNAATVWKASRIGCSLATDCANVNGFWSDAILTRDRLHRHAAVTAGDVDDRPCALSGRRCAGRDRVRA
jgi:hypothetical protein